MTLKENLEKRGERLKRNFAKQKVFLKSLLHEDNREWQLAKKIIALLFGAGMGSAYYHLAFSHAFTADEKEFREAVMFSSIAICALGCCASSQCCCIALLCIPNIATKSGRGALQALVTGWVLVGPAANLMYHGGEAIRSVTCVAQLQAEQMGNLIQLIHHPITAGFRAVVEESVKLNETEKLLVAKLTELREEVEGNDPELEKVNSREKRRSEKYKSVKEALKRRIFRSVAPVQSTIVDGDVAGKLKQDTIKRCEGVFVHGINECKAIFRRKEQDCHDTIKIPFIKHILCSVMKATFLCNAVAYFDSWCLEVPTIDDEAVNRNYSEMGKIIDNVDQEFMTNMYWKIRDTHEDSASITIDEMVHQVRSDFDEKKIIMDIAIAMINKIIAVTFVLVLLASSSYNKTYLCDPRFENLYITSYFERKDSERRLQDKRHLLPLTRLEKRTYISPLSPKLTLNEKKSMVFRIVNVVMQCLFISVIFLFDYVIYLVLDMITRHGKVDFKTTGYHKLNIFVGGNGTVAHLLQHVFKPYTNNELNISANSSNHHCLPVASSDGMTYMPQVYSVYAALLGLIFLESYIMRGRRFLCSLFYPKQEKRRIIFLYNDLLRGRKNNVQRVKDTIKKLSRAYELNQRYGFVEALFSKFPKLRGKFGWLGIGRRACLICETKVSKKHPLVYCQNDKCRSAFCAVCWKETKEECWVCENSIYANKKIEERLIYEQERREREYQEYKDMFKSEEFSNSDENVYEAVSDDYDLQ